LQTGVRINVGCKAARIMEMVVDGCGEPAAALSLFCRQVKEFGQALSPHGGGPSVTSYPILDEEF